VYDLAFDLAGSEGFHSRAVVGIVFVRLGALYHDPKEGIANDQFHLSLVPHDDALAAHLLTQGLREMRDVEAFVESNVVIDARVDTY
jgi:hypothetical protein